MNTTSHLVAIASMLTQAGYIVEQEADCLAITNDEGLDAFLYVGTSQIVVSTALFPVSQVKDKAALDDFILRTHQVVPLTSVGISTIGELDYYTAFGALSVDSKLEVIQQEIDTLMANTPELLDAFMPYLNGK